MLLTITVETQNALDIGYLLYKNPANVFREKVWFGEVCVFYPEAEAERCTVALLVNVDPIELVRGSGRRAYGLGQYINDRPYVASSLLSVALITAFRTALNGISRERPERVGEAMQVQATLTVPCRGGADLIHRLFAPLGYTVAETQLPLDPRFPEWGDSQLYTVTLMGVQTLQALLTHLYVLVPVLDNAKHYFIGESEMEKLLEKGGTWLPNHPEHLLITRRYLGYRQALVRDTMARLTELREDTPDTQAEQDAQAEAEEADAEQPMRLNDARLAAVLAAVRERLPAPERALDLGCGEGRYVKMLLGERSLKEVVGVDVAPQTLDFAARRLHLDTMNARDRKRLQLIQGSVVYRDDRFLGFDVALLVEVIEHLDPPRLQAMERSLFQHARPRRVIVTTPNREYNAAWPSLPAGQFRHRDHRFEWTRQEFQSWAERVAGSAGYQVAFSGIGPADEAWGCPTQMAIFDRE